MTQPWKLLILLGFALLLILIGLAGFGMGLIVLLLLAMAAGWALLIFFHYRHLRQEELAGLLASAVDGGQPLTPALWAYVEDRPNPELRLGWTTLLLFVFPPAYAYYWVWHRWHSFDRKVERLARLLDAGLPLPEALRQTPGVAAPETVLAAEVGQTTGRLGECLRAAPQWRLAPVWLETWPRLLYPLIVLVFLLTIVAFEMIFIVPKFEKIFADFKLRLPYLTEVFINASRWLVRYEGLLGFGLAGLLLLIALPLFSSWVRWYLPGLGWLERRSLQARLLQMLALLLETKLPAPQALALLIDSGYFRGPALRRLLRTAAGVNQGEPLGEQLQRHGLLPGSMLPLVQAAQRANNLPWALRELGDHLGRQTVRLTERLCNVLFPLLLAAIGVLVAVVVIGIFECLVVLIQRHL